MPYSSEEGKNWFREVFYDANPTTIVDVGPGAGVYAARYRRTHQHWTGIEIFEPYVRRFQLHSFYDHLIIGDVREVDLPRADAYIFGDVIEHFEHDEVKTVIDRAKQVTNQIFVSLPIVPWEQGPSEGNDHEAHLYHWTKEEIRDLLQPTSAYIGDVVGVFHWTLD